MSKIHKASDINEVKETISRLRGYGSIAYLGGILIGLVFVNSLLVTSILDTVEIICLTAAGCVLICMGGWISVEYKRVNKEIMVLHHKEKKEERKETAEPPP